MWYPSEKDAKNANKLAVEKFRATKAERFEVLSHQKIKEAIDLCKRRKGNIEEKSACLLKSFADKHPFASANRRTGYIMMNEFLWKNAGYAIAKKKQYTSQLFKEIRRRDVSEKEILDWYKAKRFI
jgi:prophage maintenance system killer protein